MSDNAMIVWVLALGLVALLAIYAMDSFQSGCSECKELHARVVLLEAELKDLKEQKDE